MHPKQGKALVHLLAEEAFPPAGASLPPQWQHPRLVHASSEGCSAGHSHGAARQERTHRRHLASVASSSSSRAGNTGELHQQEGALGPAVTL